MEERPLFLVPLLLLDVHHPLVAEAGQVGLAAGMVSPLAVLLPCPAAIDAGVLLEGQRDHAQRCHKELHVWVGHYVAVLDVVVGQCHPHGAPLPAGNRLPIDGQHVDV